MRKINPSDAKQKIELLVKDFELLTSNHENKVPNDNSEINLAYDKETAPVNVQYFATDVGSIPYQGTLEDYKEFFRNAEESMKENNIRTSDVTFDFGSMDSGIRVRVFRDQQIENADYVKKIKELHDQIHDLKGDLVDNVDNYNKIHLEYSSAAPSKAIDKAHQKLIKPFEDGIKMADSALGNIEDKLQEYAKSSQRKKPN